MNKINLSSALVLILLIFSVSTQAQVKGLSYTLSPSVEYNFFNNESGIANGTLGGAQLGFGFGQLVELRGLYFRDVDLTTDLNRFGVDIGEGIDTSFMGNPLDLERYGAEIKLNLGTNALSPFVVAGTGIQSIGLEGEEPNKQIYLSGGVGLQLSVADRFTFTLQGLRNSYRSNAVQQLLGEDELETLGLDPMDFDDTDYSSWAGRASLLIYIGGRRPGTYTDTDRAYANKFKRGFSLAIEPTVNRTDFNESLPYRDAYFGGAFVGFDFGPMIGIRGFYMRAMQEGSWSKFEDLALIGGEARFRLGDNQGLTPFFTLGGGQIRPGDDYEVSGDATLAKQAFASGGAGINLSLGKYANLTAYGRSLLTSNKNVTEISSVDAITNSWSYGLSLNLLIGGASDVEVDNDMDYYSDEDNDEMRQMNKELDKIDKDLDKAIRNQDREKVMSLSKEREIALQRLSLVEKNADEDKSNNKDENEADEKKSIKEIRMIRDMSDEEFIAMMNERDSYDSRENRNSKKVNDEEMDIQAEIDRILKERDDEDRNRRAEEEIKKLREELNDLYENGNDKKSSRNDDDSKMQDQIDELRDYIKDMREQDEKRRKSSRDDDEDNGYSKEIEELRKELREMRNKNSDKESDGLFENELKELRKEIKELREGGSNERSKSEYSNQYSKEIEELRKELKDLRDGDDDKNRKKEGLSKSERMIEELRNEIKSLKDDNKDSKRSNESNQVIEELRQEIKEMKEERSGKSKKKSSDINQSLIDDVKTEIEEMESEMDGLDDASDESKKIKRRVDKLKKELKKLQDGSAEDGAMNTSNMDDGLMENENDWYSDDTSPRVRSAFISKEDASGFFSKLRYNGASGITGFSFGNNASLNIGYRMHYIMDGHKNLEFMPETYFGFSSPSNFGILANLNYHLRGAKRLSKKGLRPYVGAGAGIIKTGSDEDSDEIRPVINLLAGTALDFLNGKLYIDFSTKNFFKYNQLVAGYMFPF